MTGSTISLELNPAESPVSPQLSEGLLSASQPYVGRWNRLISTSNWEKGRIICQWRSDLLSAGSVSEEYSDEAWSNLNIVKDSVFDAIQRGGVPSPSPQK